MIILPYYGILTTVENKIIYETTMHCFYMPKENSIIARILNMIPPKHAENAIRG